MFKHACFIHTYHRYLLGQQLNLALANENDIEETRTCFEMKSYRHLQQYQRSNLISSVEGFDSSRTNS